MNYFIEGKRGKGIIIKICKVNLVYFSPTKTTQKVVREIASAFDTQIVEYDYTYQLKPSRKPTPVPAFSNDELVIVGSPVYAGRVPLIAEAFYQSIKGKNTPAIPIVVYGNREFDDALLELCDYLKENDFKVICAGAFIGEHSYGPEIAGGRPNKNDLIIAKSFGEQAKAKLESSIDTNSLPEISVDGNRPYKARASGEPWCPEVTEACDKCGICITSCPMGIIRQDDPSKVSDPSLCIHCCNCIKNCPHNARQANAEPYLKFKTFLIQNLGSVHKDPKIYL